LKPVLQYFLVKVGVRSFILLDWREYNPPDHGMTKAIKQIPITAIVLFCISANAARSDENQSAFYLTLTDVKTNKNDLSITGTISLKNKTGLEYTIPYFIFGLSNPTIFLTINGKETSYKQAHLEIVLGSPTTVAPFSTITEDFNLELSKEGFASAPTDIINPGVYKIRLQAKYRSVYSDFRSYFPLRISPTNVWLGELRSNTVEIDFRPGK
jgi:hypothetical protein